MFLRSIVCLIAVLMTSSALGSIQKKTTSALSIFKDPEASRLYHSLDQEVLNPKPRPERQVRRRPQSNSVPGPSVIPVLAEETKKAMAFLKGVESTIPKPPAIQTDLLYRGPSYGSGRKLGIREDDQGLDSAEFSKMFGLGIGRGPQQQRIDGIGVVNPGKPGPIKDSLTIMIPYRRAFLSAFEQEWQRLKGLQRYGNRSAPPMWPSGKDAEFLRAFELGRVDGIELANALHSGDFECYNKPRKPLTLPEGPSSQSGPGIGVRPKSNRK